MFVETAVSSRNTSFEGSRSSCPSNHASRASATSSLSCSDAWPVFFLRVILCRARNRQTVPWPKPTPWRSLIFSRSSMIVRSGCSSICARMNSACASMRRDLRSPPIFEGATLSRGFDALRPTNRGRRTDVEPRRGLTTRHSASDRLHHLLANIHRQRHDPPPAASPRLQLDGRSFRYGNPGHYIESSIESACSDNALL